MKTAIFSNGFSDTYQGNRDVKAAWMVVDSRTGEVVASGHSLTRIAATKTSSASVPRLYEQYRFFDAESGRVFKAGNDLIKANNLPNCVPAIRSFIRRENDSFKGFFKVEIVDI